ncbi:hypothetical protein [Kingella oralis]|uniref:hypothetical protein n=1 Tax=Kingella oralis TaxID=505 RepID=UPI0034E4213D
MLNPLFWRRAAAVPFWVFRLTLSVQQRFQAAFKDKIIGSLKTEKTHFRLPHPPPQGSLKPAPNFQYNPLLFID